MLKRETLETYCAAAGVSLTDLGYRIARALQRQGLSIREALLNVAAYRELTPSPGESDADFRARISMSGGTP